MVNYLSGCTHQMYIILLASIIEMNKKRIHNCMCMYCVIISPLMIVFIGEYNSSVTVKPVFKGHCDEGTTCDQGTLSQNGVLSSLC